MTLESKTVFITGASSGIGEACAIEYAKAGANLILTARRLDRLQALAEKLQQEYQANVIIKQLDVSKSEQVTQVVNELDQNWREIDIVINNAGMSSATCAISELTIQQIDEMIDINTKGLLYVTHEILPTMLARNSGHIINIGSIASHRVFADANVYPATKHAVKAISESLRIDLLGTNIRVSQVDPGPVYTEFSEKRWKCDKARVKAFYEKMQPLTAEDIAETVVFCTTRKAHINIDHLIVNSISMGGNYLAQQKTSLFDE